ncbi:dTDP-4-dehydrorhamnose 3,5-epimerase [Methanocalculus taiwanensis]|uniref:dTDP-4-dehydrorhamnose 3,5-epimerase n=2 Tax=Methanocalculus taiwanensis TaxID=106207 RepID=A0ABD4TJ37_9EURY|nr:dTDP-4-dehydrorhamnose 3,5-epimerase [Methanocalculus taiwanensis]
MIEGVQIIPLRTILDERGMVRHMIRSTDPHFSEFGEIYFSVIFPGAIKAWHVHRKMELNYAVISGNIKLVLYDARDNSQTRGVLEEIFMGEDNYVLVKVPPHVVNGFTGVGGEKAIVANCASIPHDPDEIERFDPFDPTIGYEWGIRHG